MSMDSYYDQFIDFHTDYITNTAACDVLDRMDSIGSTFGIMITGEISEGDTTDYSDAEYQIEMDAWGI